MYMVYYLSFLLQLISIAMIQGCDASILLDSDHSTHKSEMVSSKNFAIRKREMIGYIKSILEYECPGKVSCADIIVLAAKESVSFSGGPHIQIPLGRKDSTTSSYQQADASLPPQGIKVHELIYIFTSKGMNLEESIAIMGNGLNN
jgi:peroxidase